MKERPILFSAPMVRAILAGRKTQTRRAAKPVFHPDLGNIYYPGALVLEHEPQHVIDRACPYGQPGDRLWVREAWTTHACFDHFPPRDLTTRSIHYLADDECRTGRYRHARFMPRWASRILLEVVSVRVERLNDISEADAVAEGIIQQKTTGWFSVPGINGAGTSARAAYALLWNSINGAGSWDKNPWVWVVEFKRIEPPKNGD